MMGKAHNNNNNSSILFKCRRNKRDKTGTLKLKQLNGIQS